MRNPETAATEISNKARQPKDASEGRGTSPELMRRRSDNNRKLRKIYSGEKYTFRSVSRTSHSVRSPS